MSHSAPGGSRRASPAAGAAATPHCHATPQERGAAAAVNRVAAVAGEWQCDGSGSAGIEEREVSRRGRAPSVPTNQVRTMCDPFSCSSAMSCANRHSTAVRTSSLASSCARSASRKRQEARPCGVRTTNSSPFADVYHSMFVICTHSVSASVPRSTAAPVPALFVTSGRRASVEDLGGGMWDAECEGRCGEDERPQPSRRGAASPDDAGSGYEPPP